MSVAGYVLSWWQQWIVIVLLICGLGLVGMLIWHATRDGLERAWDWLRHDRAADLPEDDDYQIGYNEDTGQYEELPPLPPERTWEQMTSHQPAPTMWEPGSFDPPFWIWDAQEQGRQQSAEQWYLAKPAWKAEIWAAYTALGLEGTGFTRAMARQVRELAP